MTPELVEAIARAICGMPSCGAPKCPCGFAYDQMDAARAALDAIKAAGWRLLPPVSAEEMKAANDAIKRMEARHNEDVEEWASVLGAKFGRYTD